MTAIHGPGMPKNRGRNHPSCNTEPISTISCRNSNSGYTCWKMKNGQLRQQLQQARQEAADLKRGVGITVLVGGKPVPTGTNVPLEALPTHTPAPGYGRPFASPTPPNERRPPDVAPLVHTPGNYPAIAHSGNEAPVSNGGRNGELGKHFL